MTQTENGNRYALMALKQKHAELAGEIQSLKNKLAWAEDSLLHIDAALLVFEPSSDPTQIPAKRKRVKLYKQGELSRTVVDALRRVGNALGTHEIASAIMEKRGYAEEARSGLTPRVRSSLAYLEKLKRVIKTGKASECRWGLRK